MTISTSEARSSATRSARRPPAPRASTPAALRPLDGALARVRAAGGLRRRRPPRTPWPGWRRTLARRAHPRAMWPDARSAIVLGHELWPGPRSPGGPGRPRPAAAISVYAQGDDYHELIKGRLKALAGWVTAAARRRGEGVRRHRAPDGKAAGRPGRAGLAGQAHQPGLARLRLLAVPGRHPDQPRPGAGRAARRPLRRLPRLPRHLPDPRLSRALSARRPRLPLLPDHRARRSDPRPLSRGHGQPHLRLRRLPGGLPVEQVRGRSPPRQRCSARTACAPRPWPIWPPSTKRPSARCFASSAVKRIGRDRFVRNVLYAIGNSGDPALRPDAAAHLDAPDETLRDAAAWAVRRLDALMETSRAPSEH